MGWDEMRIVDWRGDEVSVCERERWVSVRGGGGDDDDEGVVVLDMFMCGVWFVVI